MKMNDVVPSELSLCECGAHVEIEYFDGLHVAECFICDMSMENESRELLIKEWNNMMKIDDEDNIDFQKEYKRILEENAGIIQRIIDYDKSDVVSGRDITENDVAVYNQVREELEKDMMEYNAIQENEMFGGK